MPGVADGGIYDADTFAIIETADDCTYVSWIIHTMRRSKRTYHNPIRIYHTTKTFSRPVGSQAIFDLITKYVPVCHHRLFLHFVLVTT